MAPRNISATTTRKSDAAVGPMLASQKSVPPLPIPTIDSTAYKYLETTRRHRSPEQYASTKAAVEEFIKSPLVQTLQQRLASRAKEPGVNSKNWLIEWLNDVAYMGYRDPVVVFVSYFY